jgi:hypothetical protein
MPSNKWVLLAIGVAVGMFVIPIIMGYASGVAGAASGGMRPNSGARQGL